ncbi:MAG: class I SAM-dependent methyltransferase [Chloroflexi bacterium]|nr:MAG: class I SAM-dependent methyltransferase [Chloroflexota bacterium]
MKVEDKYSQADVVAFWSRFAQSGLQRAEALMLERYAPPAPARVLDLGCGPGRVTLALVPLGYDVIGLDVTPAMLQAARSSSTACAASSCRPTCASCHSRASPLKLRWSSSRRFSTWPVAPSASLRCAKSRACSRRRAY